MKNERKFIKQARRGLTMIVALAAIIVAPAAAHDSKLHKGKATNGEVISVAKDRLQIKTAQGVKTILVTEDTKLEHGHTAVALTDLKEGDPVSVIGTTLASGEISAREILLKPEGSQKTSTEDHPAGHKH